MMLKKQVIALLLALALLPAFAFAEEMKGTIKKVDQGARTIVVDTRQGEKTFSFRGSTEGMDAAKDGAKVTIEYEDRGSELRARKIMAR
jgi:hypothetical protein